VPRSPTLPPYSLHYFAFFFFLFAKCIMSSLTFHRTFLTSFVIYFAIVVSRNLLSEGLSYSHRVIPALKCSSPRILRDTFLPGLFFYVPLFMHDAARMECMVMYPARRVVRRLVHRRAAIFSSLLPLRLLLAFSTPGNTEDRALSFPMLESFCCRFFCKSVVL